jgi:hypothetical protein
VQMFLKDTTMQLCKAGILLQQKKKFISVFLPRNCYRRSDVGSES